MSNMKNFILILVTLLSWNSLAMEDLSKQNITVLKVAEKYYTDGFNGVVLDFTDYYSKDYHSSGWIEMLGSAEKLARKNA